MLTCELIIVVRVGETSIRQVETTEIADKMIAIANTCLRSLTAQRRDTLSG